MSRTYKLAPFLVWLAVAHGLHFGQSGQSQFGQRGYPEHSIPLVLDLPRLPGRTLILDYRNTRTEVASRGDLENLGTRERSSARKAQRGRCWGGRWNRPRPDEALCGSGCRSRGITRPSIQTRRSSVGELDTRRRLPDGFGVTDQGLDRRGLGRRPVSSFERADRIHARESGHVG